jgi:hypothetical protein
VAIASQGSRQGQKEFVNDEMMRSIGNKNRLRGAGVRVYCDQVVISIMTVNPQTTRDSTSRSHTTLRVGLSTSESLEIACAVSRV